MNDKTITVYNFHKADKTESWHRTVIRGVEYSFKHEKTVSTNGTIVLSELLTVVIPKAADSDGKNYLEYPEYLKLSAEDADRNWTLNPAKNRDVIVCGECFDEITNEYTITDLQRNYMKSGTVAGFSDNTEGALLKHYKVVCK